MSELVEVLRTFWANLQSGQLNQLGPWNYLVLAFFMVWQGPIATLLGGAAAAAGLLKPGWVFLAGIVGNLAADVVWYSLGRRGKVDRLFDEGGKFSNQRGRYQRLRGAMRHHATKILLMAKLSAGLAVPALVTAGITRVEWRKWFPVVFIGETIWTGSLLLLGFYATEAIKQVEDEIQLLIALMSFIFLMVVVWYLPHLLHHQEDRELPPGNKNHPA
jgi:membrane protein DedA with SNARE-associated domain